MECDESDKFNVVDVSDKEPEMNENNVNNEGLKISKDPVSYFMTAPELFAVRDNLKNKTKDDLELYKGHKFYYPSDCPTSEEIIEDIMIDNEKSLKSQRVAKSKDSVKAVWNEDEKVAVVPYLKGKTTQHMGITVNGKCVLSSEEALFLLEKGIIEVEYNKLPLSVEEAYSVMLKGKLAVEKYEVYTHLSQQGFIVVHHQSRIGPSYLTVMNLSRKKKRKRKAEESTQTPERKRLTFSGVFTSNSVSAEKSCDSLSSSNDKFILSDTFKSDENIINANEKMDTDLINNDVTSSNFDEINSQASLDREAASNNDIISSTCTEIDSHVSLGKESNISYLKEQTKENNVKELDISTKDSESFAASNNICMEDKQVEIDKTFEKISNVDNTEVEFNEIKNNENGFNIRNIKDNFIDIERVDNNEIGIENINKESIRSDNDGDTNEVIIEEDQKSDINVEDSGTDYDDNEENESTDESIPVVCEESNEGSLDVYSCSPSDLQDEKDLNIEAGNMIRQPSKVQDEEITLVRVMKKEKKPLAVIDLLSDEEDNEFGDHGKSGSNTEKNGKRTFEDSDEEIEVLDEVAGTGSNKNSSHRSVNAIKLESAKLKTESSDEANVKTQYKPQMKYPDTFRKDMICISRPFLNLLPIRCQPAKEVYILYTDKSRSNQPRSGRLWNSYKDMQEYQRERRRQRNSFASRSSGPFRDQNDTFSNQISPFFPPEYSRDFSVDRNQNYSGNFFPPANSERGLLPTPTTFNSPSHLPFSMNVHNLQNLSTSNPTAFVNEIQKTVYSVASNMISTILNQHLNPVNSHPTYPEYNSSPMNFSPNHNNFSVPPGMPGPMSYNSSSRNDFHPVRFPPEPAFSGDRHPLSMNESPFMMENNWKQSNNFRQRNFNQQRGPSFPCKYRAVRRKRDWNDVKAAVEGANLSDSGSDIEEVPINLNRFLYSNDIKPLVDPGTKLPVADGLKALKLTQLANLCDTNKNIERYLPTATTIEISFDVYLPNTKYRRSEPGVPNYRIIVVRASDPIPRYSELVNLQKKWNDGAILQVAVVDHGDISFYSFNNVNIQELEPFDALHG